MNHQIQLTLPLFIDLPRKTKKDRRWYINLNNYRNSHYQILNQVKYAYQTEVWDQLGRMQSEIDKFLNKTSFPYSLQYRFWKRNRGAIDMMNVISVIDKFTCDALVQWGLLPDDTCEFIQKTESQFMGIDRKTPRVELIITPMNSNNGQLQRPF